MQISFCRFLQTNKTKTHTAHSTKLTEHIKILRFDFDKFCSHRSFIPSYCMLTSHNAFALKFSARKQKRTKVIVGLVMSKATQHVFCTSIREDVQGLRHRTKFSEVHTTLGGGCVRAFGSTKPLKKVLKRENKGSFENLPQTWSQRY